MGKKGRKLVFLEPAQLSHETDEQAIERLAEIFHSMGFDIIDDRPNKISSTSSEMREDINKN